MKHDRQNKTDLHALNYTKGSDPRNHVVRCSCGYAFSSTYLAVRMRGAVHVRRFAEEHRTWADPKRDEEMPSFAPRER